jgi:hypothetical protein
MMLPMPRDGAAGCRGTGPFDDADRQLSGGRIERSDSSALARASAPVRNASRDGPALAQVPGMQSTLGSIAHVFAASILLIACGSKTPPPKSTTTTSSQSSTTTDTGKSVSTDTTEVTTQQADGSTTNEKTQTTKTESPKP